MSVMALAWVLVSCDVAPYEDYWPDAGAAPQITGLEPAYTGSLRGGGRNLADPCSTLLAMSQVLSRFRS